ncbi:MAG: HisA/HisF-related TIM barrel protein, partial [Desulfuromonadaceae bacterium]
MLVIPAIDLKEGRCVRLEQGLMEKDTVYSDSPAAQAKVWQE